MIDLARVFFPHMEISVETLLIEDCLQLEDVHAQAFQHGWTAEDFHSLLAQGNVFGFVARIRGKPHHVCGFVLARLVAGEAEILTIAVARENLRQGIGRALMDAALRHLHQERAETLFLEVDQNNIAAQTLYQRLHFEKVGERPAYYETATGRSSAFILRRDLSNRLR